MPNREKIIQMRLCDGTLDGVLHISSTAWNVKILSAPRELIYELFVEVDCKQYGIYLLLSDQQLYVGQASDLESRTRQHLSDKDWWTKVVLMTTTGDSFDKADIDYLEARLIEMALESKRFGSDNKKRGNPQRVGEYRKPTLEHYLQETLFLLNLIGVWIFNVDQKNDSAVRPRLTYASASSCPSVSIAQAKQKKPDLPSTTLRPGAFAKTAFINLLNSGYTFTDEQMSLFGSIEGSKIYTTRNLPMFWVLKKGETRSIYDKNIRSRYWKEEFVSGQYRFLMYSQWYDNPKNGATRDHFTEWYNTL